jgi:signal transduction histidine kinase
LVAMAEIAGSAIQRAAVLSTLEQRVEARTRQLEEANVQLQRLDVLKTRFVSEVSHELRTPIANLTLYIDLFKRSQNKPDKQQKYIEVLEKQATRLAALVENVLYLSRLDLAKEQLVLTVVDVNDIVSEVLQAQYLRAEALGLELTYEAKSYMVAKNPWQEGARPFQVLGERNQLAQMITHLVTNALSYTPHGHVHITLAPDGPKYLLLEIADSGVGIDSEEWDDLFKRFYRGRNATQLNIPGNGLGLAIADEIVKIHKGRIDLTSEVGVGTTFRVWLPAMRVY